MKPFYRVSTKPKSEMSLKLDQEFEKKVVKNKPWFLIMNKSNVSKESIIFSDKKSGTKAIIKSDGMISYEELIFLKNEIDTVRTIAIACGMLKLAKVVYFDSKMPFLFSFEMKNIKNKKVMESQELNIFGNIESEADNILVERSVEFDKNFDSYEFVFSLIMEVLDNIKCPIDEDALKKEIRNAIQVLDNPLIFAIKTSQQ
jgi:hypothetical protein